MNSRERTLIGVAGLVAVFFIMKWVISDFLLAPVRSREAQLEQLQDNYDSKKLELAAQEKAAKDLAAWKKLALPTKSGFDPGVTYDSYIRELVKLAGISNPKFTVNQLSSQQKHFATLPVRIDMSCTPEQLSKLLYHFEATPQLHRIKTLNVNPEVKDDQYKGLNVTLDIEALALHDAGPIRDIQVPKKHSTKKYEDFLLFSQKNIFQPTNVESVTQVVRQTQREDHRDKVRFTAAIQTLSGVQEFWFGNEVTSKTVIVKLGDKLEIPGMSATVASFDAERNMVILKVDGKLGGVRLGDKLNTWKESTGPAVAALRE